MSKPIEHKAEQERVASTHEAGATTGKAVANGNVQLAGAAAAAAPVPCASVASALVSTLLTVLGALAAAAATAASRALPAENAGAAAFGVAAVADEDEVEDVVSDEADVEEEVEEDEDKEEDDGADWPVDAAELPSGVASAFESDSAAAAD
jgi:phosphoribosylcarboxyaminoimidazole (NCAIR) mutase